jgi:hypothetical protein
VVTFSRREVDRAREEGFLTPERLLVLEPYLGGPTNASLRDGRLILTRRWEGKDRADVTRLHDEIRLLARRIVGGQ